MKQRIECSRANPIAVLGEFFDQPESVDRVLRCVMQHVEFDAVELDVQNKDQSSGPPTKSGKAPRSAELLTQSIPISASIRHKLKSKVPLLGHFVSNCLAIVSVTRPSAVRR